MTEVLTIPVEEIEQDFMKGLLNSPDQSGAVQARNKYEGCRRPHTRKWKVISNNASRATLATILQLWEDTNQGTESFVWRPPDEPIGLLVVFGDGGFDYDISNGKVQFKLELEEF